jgi:hypothetical protein
VWALVTFTLYMISTAVYTAISNPRHYKRHLSVSDPFAIVELVACIFCAMEVALHVIVKGPKIELLSNTWVIASLITVVPLFLHAVCLQCN